MVKNQLASHLIVTVLYSLGVTLLGQYFRPEFLLFWLGGIIGCLILYLDPLLSAYLVSPIDQFTQDIKQLVREKRYKEAMVVVLTHDQNFSQPLLHSALFQVALTVLSFYIVTSSVSLFGVGFIIGMALHLIQDELRMWKTPLLGKMLFWNIHREISTREQKIYLLAILAIFIFETVLLIW